MACKSNAGSNQKTKESRSKRSDDQKFNAAVISFVKPLGCLYDSQHKDFNDEDAVAHAWQVVVDSCKPNYPSEPEEELWHRAQKAWENSKKAFSKERSRREQPDSTKNRGWSLYEHMTFMDQHMRKTSNKSKKRKRTEISQTPPSISGTPGEKNDADSSDSIEDDTLGADEVMHNDEDLELQRREQHLKALEERAQRERQIDIKTEQVQAERDQARERAELQKQERETRKLNLQQQAKKKDCQKRLNKITADHVVATLDASDNDDDRKNLIKKIMNILYSD